MIIVCSNSLWDVSFHRYEKGRFTYMNGTIHRSGRCMSLPVSFPNSKSDFNLVMLHLAGNSVFVCLSLQHKIDLLCPSDVWDVQCLLLQVWWMSHDQSAHTVYVITSVVSSEDLWGSDAAPVLLPSPVLSYLLKPLFSSAAFCHPWHEVSNGRRAVY